MPRAHTLTGTYVYVCMHTCSHVPTHAHMHKHIPFACVYSHIQMQIHSHTPKVRIWIHTCALTCAYVTVSVIAAPLAPTHHSPTLHTHTTLLISTHCQSFVECLVVFCVSQPLIGHHQCTHTYPLPFPILQHSDPSQWRSSTNYCTI